MDFGLGSLFGSLFSALGFQRSDQESDQSSQVSPLSSAFNHAAGAGVHLGQMVLPAIVPWLGNYSVLTKTLWSFGTGDEKQGLADLKTLIANLPFGSLTQILDGIYSLTSREAVSSTEALSQIAFGALGLACDVQGFRTAKLSLGNFLDRETARLWNPFYAVRVPHFGREVAGTGMRESDLFGIEVEEAGVLKKIWNALSTSTGGSRRVELPDYLDRKLIDQMYQTQDGKLVGRISSVERSLHRDKVVIHYYEGDADRGDIKIEYLTHEGKVSSWSDIEVSSSGNYHGFELYIQHLRASYRQGTIDQENVSARNVGRYLWSHLDGLKLERTSLENFREQMLSLSDSYSWGLTIDQLRRVNSPLGCSEAIVLNEAVPSLLSRVQRLFPHITDERIQLEMTKRPGRLVLMETRPGGGVIEERLPPYYEAILDFRDPMAMEKFERSVQKFWMDRGLAPRGTPVVGLS